MSLNTKETVQCPQCGADQEATVWRSLNVGLEPELRSRLFSGGINLFECTNCQQKVFLDSPLMYHDMLRQFAVQYYPPQNLSDDKFIGCFEPSNPPRMKNLPARTGYLAQPHIVFDMNDLIHCIVFHERIRGAETQE